MSFPSIGEYVHPSATFMTQTKDHEAVLNELKKIIPITYNSIFYKHRSSLEKIISIVNTLMKKITAYNTQSPLLRPQEMSVIEWVKEATLVLKEHQQTMEAYGAALREDSYTRISSIHING